MTTRGKFIVLEGGEGSGKGTISAHLQKVLKDENVIFTREPGGTPLGEELRTLIFDTKMSTMTELLLFEAGRAEHLDKVILPALLRGTHVICDRFDASTYAYQVTARWKKQHAQFFELVNTEVLRDVSPDLYLFCDISPEAALARRMAAGGEVTRFDEEDLSFHEAVYRGYKEFLKDKRFVAIDATMGIPEVIAIAESVVRTEFGL